MSKIVNLTYNNNITLVIVNNFWTNHREYFHLRILQLPSAHILAIKLLLLLLWTKRKSESLQSRFISSSSMLPRPKRISKREEEPKERKEEPRGCTRVLVESSHAHKYTHTCIPAVFSEHILAHLCRRQIKIMGDISIQTYAVIRLDRTPIK